MSWGGGTPDPTGLVTWYEMFAVLFPYPAPRDRCEGKAVKTQHESQQSCIIRTQVLSWRPDAGTLDQS